MRRFLFLFVLFLENFVMFWSHKNSRIILYISCANSGIIPSSKEPGSFYWRTVLEISIWVLCILFAAFRHSLLTEQRNMCVNTNPGVNIYLYLFYIYIINIYSISVSIPVSIKLNMNGH